MKRILEVGDIIRVTSANNSYYGYDVEITEVTNKMESMKVRINYEKNKK